MSLFNSFEAESEKPLPFPWLSESHGNNSADDAKVSETDDWVERLIINHADL